MAGLVVRLLADVGEKRGYLILGHDPAFLHLGDQGRHIPGEVVGDRIPVLRNLRELFYREQLRRLGPSAETVLHLLRLSHAVLLSRGLPSLAPPFAWPCEIRAHPGRTDPSLACIAWGNESRMRR
jgi:hypothetical protein